MTDNIHAIFTPTSDMIEEGYIYQVRVRYSPTKLVPRFFGNTTITEEDIYEVTLECYCNNIMVNDATTSGVALPAELAAFNEINGA